MIKRGECFGLIGESGSGKSSVSKCIMRAYSPDSGLILFNDHGNIVDLAALREKDLYLYRPKIQMFFLAERSVKNSS